MRYLSAGENLVTADVSVQTEMYTAVKCEGSCWSHSGGKSTSTAVSVSDLHVFFTAVLCSPDYWTWEVMWRYHAWRFRDQDAWTIKQLCYLDSKMNGFEMQLWNLLLVITEDSVQISERIINPIIIRFKAIRSCYFILYGS